MKPQLGLEHHAMRLARLATEALDRACPQEGLGVEGETLRELAGPPINIIEQTYADQVRVLELITPPSEGEEGSPLYDRVRKMLTVVVRVDTTGEVIKLEPGNPGCDKDNLSPQEIAALAKGLGKFSFVLGGMVPQKTKNSA